MDLNHDEFPPPRRSDTLSSVLSDTSRRARGDPSRHMGYSWISDIPPPPSRRRSRQDRPLSILLDNPAGPRSPAPPRSPVSRHSRSRTETARYNGSDSDSDREERRRERRPSRTHRRHASRSPTSDSDRYARELLEIEREKVALRRERDRQRRDRELRDRERERLVLEKTRMEQESARLREQIDRLKQEVKVSTDEGEDMETRDSADPESNRPLEAHEQEANQREPAIPENGEGLESREEVYHRVRNVEDRGSRERRQRGLGEAAMRDTELRRKAERDADNELKKKAIEEYKRMQEEIELKAKRAKEEAERLFKDKLKAEFPTAGYSEEDVERILKDNNNSRASEGESFSEREQQRDTFAEEEAKETLLKAGLTVEQIEDILTRSRKARRGSAVGGLGDASSKPTYIKVHRKYLLPQTLDFFELPWEQDHTNPDYLIIKRWVPKETQDQLFAHTKKLKENARPSAELGQDVDAEIDVGKLFIVRRKTPSGRSGKSWMFS